MKNYTSIQAVLTAALLGASLTACSGGSGTDEGAESTTGPAVNTGTDPGVTETGTTGGTTEDPVDPTTEGPVDPTTSTTVAPTTTDEPETTGTTGDDPGFVFPNDPYDAYEQIDRHGAVEAGTAGILAKEGLGFKAGSDISLRDAYNKSNPVEDKAGMWVPEIAKSVMFFHGALDDDLKAAGLVPATFDETIAQAGPVIIPDTIKYDPTQPTAYPNGRKLEDPVVDITLAAVLLKLGAAQPLSVLADLPLNPPANDVPFASEFPFLAPPHLD